ARMRWSLMMLSYTEARRAEKDLDAMAGDAPAWLQVLETGTRARFASQTGDELRARALYARLLEQTPAGSANHAAALAGVAGATARMALQGLADRSEAERLLREALVAQRRVELIGYNAEEIGADVTTILLAMILGDKPEARQILLSDGEGDHPLVMDVMIHG